MRCEGWPIIVVGALACGPVDPPPPSTTPANSGCLVGLTSCAKYDFDKTATLRPECISYQGDSICEATDSTLADTVLVITIGEGTAPIPTFSGGEVAIAGQTIVTTVADAQMSLQNNGASPLFPTSVGGAYIVDPAIAAELGRNLHQSADKGILTTLPVTVTYWPEFGPPLVPPGACQDASCVGLPVPPIVAAPSPPNWPAGDVSTGALGPGGAPALGWTASLPGIGSSGTYVREVRVEPPFDDTFPAEADLAAAAWSDDVLDGHTSTVMGNHGLLTVTRSDGGSLEGWQIFVQDLSTGRPVSNLVTLHGSGTTAARLTTVPPPAPPQPVRWGVVMTPTDPGLPGYSQQLLGGAPLDVVYPIPPPSLKIQGVVRAPNHQPASASIVFESTALLPKGAGASLTYQTETVTDDISAPGEPVGRYSIALPQGSYSVSVTPLDPSLAKVTVLLDVLPGASEDLLLGTLQTVSGSCRVSDGRPLAGADVDLAPAVSLRSDPTTPVRTWPRAAHTVTKADGTFSVAVDSGDSAFYDITVRPVAGSRLPWIVSPKNQVINALALDTLVAYAPSVEHVSLRFGSYGIPATVIRAFAFASDGTAHEIGLALTDISGDTDLFLARLAH